MRVVRVVRVVLVGVAFAATPEVVGGQVGRAAALLGGAWLAPL